MIGVIYNEAKERKSFIYMSFIRGIYFLYLSPTCSKQDIISCL